MREWPPRRGRSARSRRRSPWSRLRQARLRWHAGGRGCHLDREVRGPRMAREHVADGDIALLEDAGRRVDELIVLALPVNGLRVEHDDADLALGEPAALLDSADELPVVQVAVAEVPAEHHARDELTL